MPSYPFLDALVARVRADLLPSRIASVALAVLASSRPKTDLVPEKRTP